MLPQRFKKGLFARARTISDWYKKESYDRLSIQSCKLEKGVELKSYLPQTPDGLEIIPVKDIELMFHEQISEIEDLVALGDSKSFDYFYGQTIRNFISYAHLLPASSGYHHEYPGGLVEHSLEVAKLSIEIAKSKYKIPASQFGDQDVIRYPRWIMAVFLNALFHDAGKFLMDMRVISDNGGHVWNPYLMDLVSWGNYRGVTKYHIDFRYGRQLDDHRYLSNVGFQFAVPKHVLAFIEKTNDNLVLKVTQALMYQYRHDYLVDIDSINTMNVEDFIRLPVKQADQLSTYRSLISYVNRFFGPGRTSMLGIFMKIMSVLRGRWEVNKKDSVVFTFEGDVYLHSPKFLFDVIDHAEYHQLPFPRDHKVVMDELINRGVVVVNHGSCIYKLKPLYYKVRNYLTVVKLSNPAILYGQDPVFESPETVIKTEYQFNKESGSNSESEIIEQSTKKSNVKIDKKENQQAETKSKKSPKINNIVSKSTETKTENFVESNQIELIPEKTPEVSGSNIARKKRVPKNSKTLNSINQITVDKEDLVVESIGTNSKQNKNNPKKVIENSDGKISESKIELIDFTDQSTSEGNDFINAVVEEYKIKQYPLEVPNELFIHNGLLCLHYTKASKRILKTSGTDIPALLTGYGWTTSTSGRLIVKIPLGKSEFKAISFNERIKGSILEKAKISNPTKSQSKPKKKTVATKADSHSSSKLKNAPKSTSHDNKKESSASSQSIIDRPSELSIGGVALESMLTKNDLHDMEAFDSDILMPTSSSDADPMPTLFAWFYELLISGEIKNAAYEKETSECIYLFPIKISDESDCPLPDKLDDFIQEIHMNSTFHYAGDKKTEMLAYYMDVNKHG